MADWYKEKQEELQESQAGKSRKEIADELKQQGYETVFDPENAPPVDHIWVDRGLKMTCEDAGHAMHEVWKRKLVRPM